AQWSPQVVRHVGEQFPPGAVHLLQGRDLLAASRQRERRLRGGGLLLVQARELGVGLAHVSRQRVGVELRPAPLRPQQADQPPGYDEGEQVDDVLLVGDRKRAHRRAGRAVDQQEAQDRGSQCRQQAADYTQRRHKAEVDEYVVALARAEVNKCDGQQRRTGQGDDPGQGLASGWEPHRVEDECKERERELWRSTRTRSGGGSTPTATLGIPTIRRRSARCSLMTPSIGGIRGTRVTTWRMAVSASSQCGWRTAIRLGPTAARTARSWSRTTSRSPWARPSISPTTAGRRSIASTTTCGCCTSPMTAAAARSPSGT